MDRDSSGNPRVALAPSVEPRSLENVNLTQVEIDANQGGDGSEWNRFMLATLEGNQIARRILERQVFLSPAQLMMVYKEMISSITLRIYDLKDKFRDLPLSDDLSRGLEGYT